MRYVLAIVVLLACLANTAFGQAAVIDAKGAKPGTYYYAITVAEDGTITVTPIKVVVRLEATWPPPGPGPQPPNPPDPPGPTPIEPDEFSNLGQRSHAWAGELFPPALRGIAPDLGKIYTKASTDLENGDAVSIVKWSEQIKAGVGDILATKSQDDRDAWAAWRGRVGEVWDEFGPLDRQAVVRFGQVVGKSLEAVK